MPFQNRNFDFQGQAPQEAIMSAYQNKAKQEYQMKLQAEQAKQNKINQTLSTIQQAANLVQQGITLSTNRQQKMARETFAGLLAKGKTGPETKAAYVKGYGGKEAGKHLFQKPLSELEKAKTSWYKRRPVSEKTSSLINAQAKSNDIQLQKKTAFYGSLNYDPIDYRDKDGNLTLKGKAEIKALTNLLKNKVAIEKKRSAITGAEYTETNLQELLQSIAPEGLLSSKEQKGLFQQLKRWFKIAPSAPVSKSSGSQFNPDSWLP